MRKGKNISSVLNSLVLSGILVPCSVELVGYLSIQTNAKVVVHTGELFHLWEESTCVCVLDFNCVIVMQ